MRWELSGLLGESSLQEHLDLLEKDIKHFEQFRAELESISAERFTQMVALYGLLDDRTSRIIAHVRLTVDTNLDDDAARAQLATVQQVLSKAMNRIRFFALWWKDLPDDRATEFSATLGKDAYVFAHMRSLREHTLSEPEENLISLKDSTGKSVLVQLYDMIDARIVYEFDGKSLTREELATKFSDADPSVRKRAYQTFFTTRAPERSVLAEIYGAVVRNMQSECELRSYDSPVSMRNKSNDLPDEVVTAHLAACKDRKDIWQRYFALKKTLLKQDVSRYDIYAPLAETKRTFTFEEAVEMTLDAFNGFSPRMRDLAKEIYDAKHVDSDPLPHKRSGAYCWGVVPGLPPYLLYNHTGKLRDVMTVAHETGHGVHHQLCRDLTPLSCGHALPIAETASVFAEMLLSERMLDSEKDDAVRCSLLASKLDDMYATVGRQSFFTLWEIDAHRMIAEGKTADDLSAAWLENLKEQFGDIIVPQEFQDEWLAIPHFFHTPFYCYAYSFGNLLTLALYEQYRKEGEVFVEKYVRFLSAGETNNPVELCKIVGADITDPAFWAQGFVVIERILSRLESLC